VSERSDHDVESDLRRLFDDERLTVHVAPGARDAVVSGARRVRRRREMAVVGSGLAVVAVAAVGVAVMAMPPNGDQQGTVAASGTGPTLSTAESSSVAPPSREPQVERVPTQSDTKEAPESEPRSEPPPPSKTSQDSSPDVPNVPLYASGPIGPSGWGPIELGMSYEEVRKAGYLGENTAPPQGCTTYVLSTRDDQVSALTISESGVGRISAGNNGRTPEGVGSGTSKEELRNTYPDGTESDGVYRADTGAGTTYEFAVPDGDEVSGFALTDGTC